MRPRSALRLLLDQVDYTATPPACRPNEQVAAVLPHELIAMCRDSLTDDDTPITGDLTDIAASLVATICCSVIGSGSDPREALLLLESVVVGMFAFAVNPAGDAEVLDVFIANVRESLATVRLANIAPAGHG